IARVDRAAQHVDEQQHDADRHDGRRDDRVDAAGDVAQGAPRENRRVGGEGRDAHAAAPVWSSPVWPAWSFVLPTTAKKISSSVGCFSTYCTSVGGSSFFSST